MLDYSGGVMTMFQYFHNVDAYVEEHNEYRAESVKLELDEATKKVTVKVVDVYNAVIAGRNFLMDETYPDLPTAIKAYEHVAHQLSQGDVIRVIPATRQLRDAGANNREASY
jgi:predicted Zn-dependent protease